MWKKAKKNKATSTGHMPTGHLSTCLSLIFPKIISILFTKLVPFDMCLPWQQTSLFPFCHSKYHPYCHGFAQVSWGCMTNQLCLECNVMSLRQKSRCRNVHHLSSENRCKYWQSLPKSQFMKIPISANTSRPKEATNHLSGLSAASSSVNQNKE